jgi:hypothetical protein
VIADAQVVKTKLIPARDLSINDRLVEKHGRRRVAMRLSEVHIDERALVVTARVRIEHGSSAATSEARGPWMPTDRIQVVA